MLETLSIIMTLLVIKLGLSVYAIWESYSHQRKVLALCEKMKKQLNELRAVSRVSVLAGSEN